MVRRSRVRHRACEDEDQNRSQVVVGHRLQVVGWVWERTCVILIYPLGAMSGLIPGFDVHGAVRTRAYFGATTSLRNTSRRSDVPGCRLWPPSDRMESLSDLAARAVENSDRGSDVAAEEVYLTALAVYAVSTQ